MKATEKQISMIDNTIPTESQISYLLSLLGYKPWNNNEELAKSIRENVDKMTVASCIKSIIKGDRQIAVLQLRHLGIQVTTN